jgi:DNA modification methylase
LKPIKLISEIAKLFKLPDIVNQKVYIPFSGSFSEVIGFVDAGYNPDNITTCEMNPEYVEIGKKRLEHYLQQNNLESLQIEKELDDEEEVDEFWT